MPRISARGAPAQRGPTDWRRAGPSWLRQRSCGQLSRADQQMSPSTELMQRLGQEACLEGHRNCVNCLEWNQRGDLLASGSDDNNVIMWDVFRRKKRGDIETGHERTVFSVKFMPTSSDSLLATCAGDGQVKVTSIYQKEKVLNCNRCHTDRVKRLAVHPHEPYLIWSAGEDGLVLEYDLRVEHVCNGSRPTNTLVNLRAQAACSQAKCIAVNPLRSEMLAVGSNDIYNRLYDRRFIKPGGGGAKQHRRGHHHHHHDMSGSCINYFAPGHLLKTNNRSNHIQTYGTTYLTFNSTGTELLASYHAEQVYLFDIFTPTKRRYESFEKNLRPILYGEMECKQAAKFQHELMQQQRSKRLKPSDVPPLDGRLAAECPAASGISEKVLANMHDLNEEISKRGHASPTSLRARAEMLLKRGWRGDAYQALRDCCAALALDPMDAASVHQLARTLVRLDDVESAVHLVEFINLHRYPGDIRETNLDLKAALKELEHFIAGAARRGRRSSACDKDDRYLQDLSHAMDLLGPVDLKAVNEQLTQSRSELKRCNAALDYSDRYCGHCNMNTDIKEANFFGPNDEFIVSGSDDGAFYIWNKDTTNIVKAAHADHHILNCVQPHPNICMLATSGMEPTVKLWSPIGPIRRDVMSLDERCAQNHKFISTDPLEAMIMMLYPDTS